MWYWKTILEKHEYYSKSAILTIKLNQTLTSEFTEKELCSLCYKNNPSECVTCRYGNNLTLFKIKII